MPTTFVTAFLDLREDRSKDKSVETCFGHFRALVETGIRIHAFISRCYEDLVPEAKNLTVEFLELEDLDTWQALQGVSYTVPETNAPYHDTANFMILMNSKVELVHLAAARWPGDHFAWIDFSIFHVFRGPETSAKRLQALAIAALPKPYIAFPGCWSKQPIEPALFERVNWRFCGGFFIGDTVTLSKLHELYLKHFRQIVLEHQRLVWEVNIWSLLESEYAFDFGWYRADHNDSIIAAPTPKEIVASLTTIPPRFELCRKTLDSLIPQVDRIYLSIPESYSRFPGTVQLPEFLAEPGYAKVSVVRSPDFGPATKYLGALGEIPETAWIFFCDDDQEYHPTLLARMSTALNGPNGPGAYQNHYNSIHRKTSGGVIHGYVGVVIHASCLKALPEFPLPPAARFVDDQWMSAYCFKNSVEIYPTSAETYPEIFQTLQDGHELCAPESLSGLNNRNEMVKELEEALCIRFDGYQILSG
jgi:hypothetical protein